MLPTALTITSAKLKAKEPRNVEHFRKGESYGYIRRARQKQKRNDCRTSGSNRRDYLPLCNEPVARIVRKHIGTLWTRILTTLISCCEEQGRPSESVEVGDL